MIQSNPRESEDAGKKRFVFLDRDGTLNQDPGYLRDPELVVLFPGVSESLGRLVRAGFTLVVVTNQSSIGRGLASWEDVRAVNQKIAELLLREDLDARIESFLVCPHAPEEQCLCRKPGTALVDSWSGVNQVDFDSSWFLGDKAIDVECGLRLKIVAERCVLLLSGEGGRSRAKAQELGARICETLPQAVELILKK